MSLADVVRRLGHDRSFELARRSQVDLSNPFVLDPEELDRFRASLRVRPTQGNVVLGRLPFEIEVDEWIGLPAERFIAMHGSCVGGTGAGKSFWVLGCLLQILRARKHAVILLDMKGETAALARDLVLPALVAEGHGDLPGTIRVIRPFDPEFAPLLRLTEPQPGVTKEVQALNLLTSIEESLSEPFGTRMSRAMLHATMLAIERREPLDAVRRWLHDRQAFARAARTSADARVREYGSSSLGKEQTTSIEAAAARLDEFLFDPATRDALAAPSCLSFAESLETGTTIIDLGDPPAGAERLSRFWGAVILGRLTRAILARPITKQSGRVWFVIDEVQEALGAREAAMFTRLLSLARAKKAAVLMVNQEPGQVSSIDPLLASALRTNVGYRVAFRSNIEDARSIAHSLPAGREQRTAAKGRELLIEQLTRLRDRHFLFWLRSSDFRAQVLRSPRLDLERMEALAASIPDATREAIRRGTTSVSREELRVTAESETPSDQEDEFLLQSAKPDVDADYPSLG